MHKINVENVFKIIHEQIIKNFIEGLYMIL